MLYSQVAFSHLHRDIGTPSLQPITPKLLSWRKWPDGDARVYQYIEDVLIEDADISEVGQTQAKIIDYVEKINLQGAKRMDPGSF